MSQALIDGQWGDGLPLDDRGLHYGDGLFETLALRDGRPCLWDLHLARLQQGCRRLGLVPPWPAQWLEDVTRLAQRYGDGVVKLILTRGSGRRGYRAEPAAVGRRLALWSPAPVWPEAHAREGVRLRVCRIRLACNPELAGIKHLNRLENVLARREWDDAHIAEGLMLDEAGRVIEGVTSNVFLVREGGLVTPDLSRCGVAGVMRAYILEIASTLGIAYRIDSVDLDDLREADEVFLSNSLMGIWPVRELLDRRFDTAEGNPLTRRLQTAIAAHCLALP